MRRSGVLVVVVGLSLTLGGCGGVGLFGGGERPRVVAGRDAAEPPAAPAEDSFTPFDRDKDGIIPKAEMEEAIALLYKGDDRNGDGFLDAAEVRAVNDRLMGQQGSTPVIDWNADGKVLLAEYASQWRTLFERSDADADGIVDARERTGRVRPRKPRELPQPEMGRYRGPAGFVPAP